ncbi:S-layer protein [Palaeococcus ferrophilus]|uniref:S-layer protein n=1 Tax=Palaeococcus ferrophilus TaxID=83868 RepID=UPI00064E602F|nr:S-layer protein [Palaeococcus ferrophilus]
MKVRKIAALAVGAAMIGATMGYASAQLNVPKDFFVKDGMPNAKIVVGSNAAAMDVASAADIAVAIGSMLYTAEEVQADGVSVVVKKDITTYPDPIKVYSNWYEDYGTVTATKYDELPTDAWWNGSAYNGSYTDWDAITPKFTTEIENMDSIKGDKQIDWDINIDKIMILDSDGKTPDQTGNLPPKSATLKIPAGNFTITFNFVIKKWEVTTSSTDPQWGLTTTSTETVVDDDQPSGGVEKETVYSGITSGTTFTLLGNEYYVLNVQNDTLTYGKDHGVQWFHVGDEMEFDGYKIQVVDISINEQRVLLRVTAPDGRNDLVIISVTDGEKDVSELSTKFNPGELVLTLDNTFVGIDGNLIAQLEIRTNVVSVSSGDEFISGWTATFLPGTGNTIETIVLTNKNDLSGSDLDILGKYKVSYEFHEWTKTADFDNDGEADDTRYTAKAQIVIDPTEKVYDEKELKVGDELEGWSIEQIKGATYTKITVNPAESITVLDTEVDLNAVDSNLILVGGPVANSVTAYLVDQGLSQINWYLSDGDIEFIENAFGDFSVIIVAGKNRESTRAAAQELLDYLKDLA